MESRYLSKAFIIATLTAAISLVVLPSCTSKKDKAIQAAMAKSGKKKAKKPKLEWIDSTGAVWRYFKNKKTWTGAQRQCKRLAKATKSFWRLPNPEELLEARREGMLTSKNPAFGWIYLQNTWTVNWESAYDQKTAVYVNMNTGREYRTTFDHDFTILCVKPREGSARYTWVDPKTNMVWRFHPHKSRWDDSRKVCQTFSQWEKKPWRLPSQIELTHAIKNGIQTSSNEAFGRDYLTHTWSQDGEAEYPEEAYAVDLRNDNRFLFSKDNSVSVLCIRPLAH